MIVIFIVLMFLFLYLIYLISRDIKLRKNIVFCKENSEKILKNINLFKEKDIRQIFLKKPLDSFSDLIGASFSCYACVKSLDDVEVSLCSSFDNKEILEDVCLSLYKNSKEVIIQEFLINSEIKKAVCYKVILDNYTVGVFCLFFDKYKIFSNEEIELIKSFVELIKLVEKSDILEEALGKSESDLETIIDFVNDGVIIVNPDLKIRKINCVVEDMIGIKEKDAIDKSLNKIIQTEEDFDIELLIQELKDIGTETCSSLNLKTKNKKLLVKIKVIPILTNESNGSYVVFIQNIEMEKKAEQERKQRNQEKERHYLELQAEVEQRKEIENALIKSAALASAGTLTAGIVHEFNNINSIVMGNLDVVLKTKNIPESALTSLKTVREMVSRGGELTRSLLNYTRETANGNRNKKWCSLLDIVKNTRNLVDKEFSNEGIKFTSNFNKISKEDKELFYVYVDESQVKQAILNIVLNARHAIVNSKDKVVSFDIYNNKDTIELQISDTGHGIPKEDLDKLFIPFFSTKGDFAKEESQKQFSGNGLGLSMCNLIMKKNNGNIYVDSEIGKGTTFRFVFNKKIEEDKKIDIGSVKESEEEVDILDGDGKRILLLDDEVEICNLLKRSLIHCGYETYDTDDGYEALKELDNKEYDLIITDIQMSKMTGIEFLNNLSTIKGKKPKIIVLTGRMQKDDLKDCEFDCYIGKPFDLYKFIEKIQELVN